MMINKIYLFIFCGLAIVFLLSRAHAVPPEGFEVWAFEKKSDSYFLLETLKTDPFWVDPYHLYSLQYGFGLGDHFHTLGYQSTSGGENIRRQYYFYRYDYRLSDAHSVDLKFIHEDLFFINTGKETMELAWNSFIAEHLYFTLGYYYRWYKQSWNTLPHNPFHFSTKDHEGFFTLVLGLRFPFFVPNSYIAMDFNNRTPFVQHSSDAWATDVKTYFKMGSAAQLCLTGGFRYSGFFGIASFINEKYMSVSVIF